MASRTPLEIEAQKRAALLAAQQQLNSASQTASIQSTPPGYIEGFKCVLTPEYKIDIYPGVVNVAGQRVELKETYTLKPEDETVTRLSAAWWYLYIDKLGKIHGDVIAPVYKSQWMGFYQPNRPWRNIGKYFVGEEHLCLFTSNWQQQSDQTVYVAPAGFTGIANYYCTGVDDQILFDAATQYLLEAYNGGTSFLLPGIFNVSKFSTNASGDATAIQIKSKVNIKGSGNGTILRCSNVIATRNASLFSDLGYSVTDARISDLQIESISGIIGGTESYLLECSNSTRLTLEHILIKAMPEDRMIYVAGACSDFGFINNDISITDAITAAAILVYIGADHCEISKNIIRDTTGAANIHCIYLAADKSIITENHIYNITSSGGSSYGIRFLGGDYNVVSNNHISDMNPGSNAQAISIDGGISNLIVGNYCINNASANGVANTGSGHFGDAGTNTQVHSNSWQSPVIDTTNFTTQLSGSTVLAAYPAAQTITITTAAVVIPSARTTFNYTVASTLVSTGQWVYVAGYISNDGFGGGCGLQVWRTTDNWYSGGGASASGSTVITPGYSAWLPLSSTKGFKIVTASQTTGFYFYAYVAGSMG